MAKDFAAMTFAEFADVMRPSGAVDRITIPGTETDVIGYSVYMNGPLAANLPAEAREYRYKDVMVNALTEKLGLNPASFRDNLKVAEIVAIRGSWLVAVQEAAQFWTVAVAPAVMDDYNLLADATTAMEHPWIAMEVERQMAMSMGLEPVLAAASQAMGVDKVKDRAPREVATGKVVSQNKEFTVQKTADGEVVTHENRRLSAVPMIGADISVSYYRGSGQVVESLEKLRVSKPYIDKASMDLAIGVVDVKGKEQVVLFNSMSGFRDFVGAHGLSQKLIPLAMEARETTPKVNEEKPAPVRVLEGGVYIDKSSRCLAIKFTENGKAHSAVFGSAQAMESCAKEFGITPVMLAAAKELERNSPASAKDVADSKRSIDETLRKLGYDSQRGPVEGQTNGGKIVAESLLHVAQCIGRGHVIVHDIRALDKVVRTGEHMTVKYQNGRGEVAEVNRDVQGVGR